MKCLKYTLAGAMIAPLVVAAIFGGMFGPALLAERWLGIHPGWGFLFTLCFVGGLLGAVFCGEERKRREPQ